MSPAQRTSTPTALLALLACAALACARASEAGAPTDAAHDAQGGARFRLVDVAATKGVDLVVESGDPRRWYIVESNGSGAAWLDYDGDGDLDLFVANGGKLVYHDQEDGTTRLEVVLEASSRLYRNDGGERPFHDATDEAGARVHAWTNAVATGDVDRDGDTDLYLAGFGEDVFLRNEGGRFVEATREAGLGNPSWGASAAFGDVDRDGDLDLFVANYVDFDVAAPPDGGRRMRAPAVAGAGAEAGEVELGWGPEAENGRGFNRGAANRFFLNEGGRFREATAELGFADERASCSYAAVFSDVDGDGWPDLLVANDLQPCQLYRNRGALAAGEARFIEEGLARGFALDGDGRASAAMGLALADVDDDGDQDVLRTNFDLEPNALHVNDGRGRFVERAAACGLAEPSLERLGWGAAFVDLDLDGLLELVVANGHVLPQAESIGMHPWLQSAQLFAGERAPDGSVRWRDASAEAGPDLVRPRSSRGLAVADFDDDGDQDILLIDLDAPPRLLENQSPRRGRWIAVRAIGVVSNPDAYGALVRVLAGGRTRTRELRTNDGLYSAHDPRAHFGLGPVERVDLVEVRWPSGLVSRIEDPPLERVLVVREPSGAAHESAGEVTAEPGGARALPASAPPRGVR